MRDDVYRELKQAFDEERFVVLATVIGGEGTGRQRLIRLDGRTVGSLGTSRAEARADEIARDFFTRPSSERVEVDTDRGVVELFVESFPPRPTLIVVGAVHIGIPLVRMAHVLGFRTVVIDPRSAFATAERFSDADELIAGWPEDAMGEDKLHESCYVVVLTHDFKIDVPAIRLALRSPARYVGVLGSRKTHARRVEKLEEAGLTGREISRIHAPIGLNLGGREPEEIAVAILAEIVAVRHGAETGRT